MNDAEHLGEHRLVRRDAFAAMLQKRGALAPDLVLGKAADPEEQISLKGDTVTFVGTSSKEDRDGDIIAVAGVNFANWSKRMVILFGHDPSKRIGVGTGIEQRGARTIVQAKYYASEPHIDPLAVAAVEMIKFNLQHGATTDVGAAFSVGFIPVRAVWNDDRSGVDFKEIEVLEFSDVSMASNPAAVRLGKAAGINLDPVMDWAVEFLKGAGLTAVNLDFARFVRDLIDPLKGMKLIELGPAHAKGLTWTEPHEILPVATEVDDAKSGTDADPVALVYMLSKLGQDAKTTADLMGAAGMGEFAQGLKDPESPAGAGAPPEAKTAPVEDPGAAMLEAVKNVDLADMLADKWAARTGNLPIIEAGASDAS